VGGKRGKIGSAKRSPKERREGRRSEKRRGF